MAIKLIDLLKQLVAETDKMNVGKIYMAIVAELKQITFVEGKSNFSNLVYKILVELSIKDFIHSGRSEASVKVINDVIYVLSNAEIVKS